MIDEQVFKDSWALLCERFNREPSRALALAYYRELSPRMDTERFKEGCNRIFRSNDFFPKPDDFLERATEDRRADALESWESVQRVMHGHATLESLNPEARRAVGMLGGSRKLQNTMLDEVQYVRRDFLEIYGDVVAIAEREEGRRIAGTPEAKRITDAVMGGGGLRLVGGDA